MRSVHVLSIVAALIDFTAVVESFVGELGKLVPISATQQGSKSMNRQLAARVAVYCNPIAALSRVQRATSGISVFQASRAKIVSQTPPSSDPTVDRIVSGFHQLGSDVCSQLAAWEQLNDQEKKRFHRQAAKNRATRQTMVCNVLKYRWQSRVTPVELLRVWLRLGSTKKAKCIFQHTVNLKNASAAGCGVRKLRALSSSVSTLSPTQTDS